MNVIHVVRDLDLASGGPSRSVPALAAALSREGGTQVTVIFRDRGQAIAALPGDWVDYQTLGGPAWVRRQTLRRVLRAVAGPPAATILHLHGLWSPLLHDAARLARQSAWPYVVSTRGMLAGWALGHKAWKKNIAWSLYQKRNLEGAAALVASSPFEAADIEAALPGSRVEIIPNGCDPRPEHVPVDSGLPGGADVRWALALGRLHPVKGYPELIEAWSALKPAGWKLAIAGPDEDGHRAHLEALIERHRLQGEVLLPGAVDDARKWALLQRCELFLAPSKTENFGMAIAEALQSGTPVITTTGTPWRELAENECGWWVAPEAAALRQALQDATGAGPLDLAAMGARSRDLFRRQYSWTNIAARTMVMYRSILDEHARG